MRTTTLYDLNGVTAWEFQDEPWLTYFGVSDAGFKHYRITIGGQEDGTVTLSVSAEWSDKHPGQLASYTHDLSLRHAANDALAISDDGLLTAMVKHAGATAVDFRHGITMQLPADYVRPMRLVIAKAREVAARMAAAKAHGKPATIPTLLTEEERTAALWWLSIFDKRESESWMQRAGNTGLVVDAYRAFQATTAGLAPAGWERVQA